MFVCPFPTDNKILENFACFFFFFDIQVCIYKKKKLLK